MNNPILKNTKDFYLFVFPNGFEYEVDKKTCRTERQANEWIAHLAEKNWWSGELEKYFIEQWLKDNSV